MAEIAAPNDVIFYNGINLSAGFSGSKLDANFIPDSSGRTVAYTLLTLTVTTKVVAGANQNATMTAIRTALERPAGQLTFTGKGYDIVMNAPGGTRDIRWGPFPKVLSWKTLGGAYAAEVTWVCQIALNNCSGASWQGKMLDYSNTITYTTDEGGYTTRTIAGSLTIPMTRVNVAGAAIPDTADNYFDNVCPPAIPNFKRTITRTLNEAKDKLTFTVTDTEQVGNPLPPGTVNAEASHRVQSATANKAIFISWTGTIEASYEFVRGKPRSAAFDIFMKLVADRVVADRAAGFWYMPLSFTIAEPEIYGKRGASLSLTYSLIPLDGKSATKSRYPKDGLWRRTGDSWNIWAIAAGFARANRGLAGLRHHANDEAIVDLCLNNGASIINEAGTGSTTGDSRLVSGGSISSAGTWQSVGRILGVPTQVDPLGSWLFYECQIVLEPIDRNVFHKPLPTSASGSNPIINGLTNSAIQALFSSNRVSFYPAVQTSPPTIVQNRGSTDFYVRLIGRAVRVGHEIPPPQLVSFAGAPAIPMNHPDAGTYFSTWTSAYTTHPIQSASWNLRYFIKLPQGGVGVPLVSPPRPDEPTNSYSGTVR